MKKTDSEIQQLVLRELKRDSSVAETEIGVEVDGGIVTLTGTVSSWTKRVAAKEAAHRVFGVLDVTNDLQVKPRKTGEITDIDLARAVRHTLDWDEFGFPLNSIHSTISAGQVMLHGTVETRTQREEAERSIRSLMEVRGVINNIEVQAPAATVHDIQCAIEDALERQIQREARRIRAFDDDFADIVMLERQIHREAHHVGIEVRNGRVKLSGVVHSWAELRAVLGVAKGTVGARNVEDDLWLDAPQ